MYIHILSSTYTYAQIYVYVYNSYIHNGLCALIHSAMVDLLVFSLESETSQFGGIFYWPEQRAFSLEDWPNHLNACLRYFEITTLEPLRHFETPMQQNHPQTNWKIAVEFDSSLKSSQTTQTKRLLRKLCICLSNNALQDTWCWEQGHELHCAASKYQQATPGGRIWPNGRNLQFPVFEMGKSMAAWWWGLQTVCFRKENRSASWQNANSLGKNNAVKHAQDFQFDCRLEEKGSSIIWPQLLNWGALPMDLVGNSIFWFQCPLVTNRAMEHPGHL